MVVKIKERITCVLWGLNRRVSFCGYSSAIGSSILHNMSWHRKILKGAIPQAAGGRKTNLTIWQHFCVNCTLHTIQLWPILAQIRIVETLEKI